MPFELSDVIPYPDGVRDFVAVFAADGGELVSEKYWPEFRGAVKVCFRARGYLTEVITEGNGQWVVFLGMPHTTDHFSPEVWTAYHQQRPVSYDENISQFDLALQLPALDSPPMYSGQRTAMLASLHDLQHHLFVLVHGWDWKSTCGDEDPLARIQRRGR